MSSGTLTPAVAGPSDVAVVQLGDVPWETYVALRDVDSNNAVRMVYDRGTLTFLSPSPFHERVTSLIGRLSPVAGPSRDTINRQ